LTPLLDDVASRPGHLVQVRLEKTGMNAPLAATLAVLVFTASAHADGLADCSQRVDPQRTIDGCSLVLDKDILSDRLRAMALNNRANAFAALSRIDEALADYDKSIATHPELAQTHLNRGMTRMNTGELAAAIADFDRALEIDPDLNNAKVNRTLAQFLSGRSDLAVLDTAMIHASGGSEKPHPAAGADATDDDYEHVRRNRLLKSAPK
jgi:tetratricopeptide (TPR) repeat protein